MTAQCGREAAPASRSLPQEGGREPLTNATSGPSSSALSGSAALQSFLESRLPAKMGSHGSMLYALTWKERVTPQGRRICALQASVRHISDSGCTGWPTPTTRDWKDGKEANTPTNSLLGREVWKISGGGAGWIACRDNKWRPAQPGVFPLVDGIPNRMGCTCAKCGTEALIYGGMYFLRKINGRNERPEQTKILQQRVHAFALAVNEYIRQECYAQQSEKIQKVSMRNMRQCIETTGSSYRQESDEQFTREFTDSLFGMSSQDTYRNQAFNVRRLWHDIQSGIASESQQDLFCPVCERVGPHLCKTEVVKNRVGRLRGYGNAIVPQVAQAFIKAVMEVTG